MKVKKVLVVFDFDGTLFKSPLKPSNWKGPWWSNIRSLSEPLVPENPGREWWNDKLCEKAQEQLTIPENYTILLTGRIDKVFSDRVNQLLEQNDLLFPYVGLAELDNSFDSKVQHLDRLLVHNPYFEKIVFYDDREEHYPLFKDYCKRKGIECEVIPVKEAYTLLEERQVPTNKVYVLVGPPGVGKSTYIRNNIAMANSTIISRDVIVERVAQENGYAYTEMFNSDPIIKELNEKINEELTQNIQEASLNENDVVVDMTNLNKKSREVLLTAFPKTKFTRIALNFMPDTSNFDNLLKINEQRDRELNKKGKKKTITRKILQTMFDRYEAPSEEEGFDRVTNIDINSRLSKTE